MATEDYCQYCWRPGGGHNGSCPEETGTSVTIAEWQDGYCRGFTDDFTPLYCLKSSSRTYFLGYRAGQAEIESFIYEAVQRNYWLT